MALVEGLSTMASAHRTSPWWLSPRKLLYLLLVSWGERPACLMPTVSFEQWGLPSFLK